MNTQKNNSTQQHANNKARGDYFIDGTPQRGRLTFIYVNREFYTHMISKAKQEKVIASITAGHSLVKACQYAKVSRATLYRHMSKHAELDANVKTAKRQAAAKAQEE